MALWLGQWVRERDRWFECAVSIWGGRRIRRIHRTRRRFARLVDILKHAVRTASVEYLNGRALEQCRSIRNKMQIFRITATHSNVCFIVIFRSLNDILKSTFIDSSQCGSAGICSISPLLTCFMCSSSRLFWTLSFLFISIINTHKRFSWREDLMRFLDSRNLREGFIMKVDRTVRFRWML